MTLVDRPFYENVNRACNFRQKCRRKTTCLLRRDVNGNADQKCKGINSPTAFPANSTDVRIPERAFSHELDEMKKRRVTRAVNTARPLRPPRKQQAVMLEIPVTRAYTPPVIDRARKKKDP